MRRVGGLIGTLALVAALATSAGADDADAGCYGEDNEQRIRGCTILIERGGLSSLQLADAYSRRALAHSLKGAYATAIRDYDVAIEMLPNFSIALNNRAWAYFRWGKAATGLPDVEASLKLEPNAAYSLDTRAHIRQTMGDPKGALNDYTKAMYYGGKEMVKLYQCGLTEAGLYEGRIDGIWRRELQQAMEKCVARPTCDPLPAAEHCRPATS